MGANSSALTGMLARAQVAPPVDSRNYNELTRIFLREIGHRTRDGVGPDCLFLDIEESGQKVWATSVLGQATTSVGRSACHCFCTRQCARASATAGAERCRVFSATEADDVRFDLVISCHSISFLDNRRAICFLDRLRQSVRSGGMLFISALGKYSALADHHPAAESPLAERFFPLSDSVAHGLGEGTQVCLYSERDLCTTLFDAGWSVVRSSTTTENNVLATAVRI